MVMNQSLRDLCWPGNRVFQSRCSGQFMRAGQRGPAL